MSLKAAIIGAGRMGQAMINGWLKNNLDIKFSLFEPVISHDFEKTLKDAGWQVNPENLDSDGYDLVIIAIKPQSFIVAADTIIKKLVSEKTLVLSIMAGMSIDRISSVTSAQKVVRAMPNTPGQIGQGITAIIGNGNCENKDLDIVETLLSPLGDVVRLEKEKEIDAVTAVSGSGPAYIFLLAEAMVAAGISEGLSQEVAKKLAIKTVIGSSKLMEETGEEPIELRRAVTSPGGTTEAAIDVLLAGGGIIRIVKNAVEAACAKSKQLGKLDL